MDTSYLKELLEKNYDISVDTIYKIKNVYKIKSGNKYFCFKVIKYKFGHFLFIINAMIHLQKNGFDKIPEFILTKNGRYYMDLEDNHGYLTEWIDARQCDYEEDKDLEMAVLKLADLHNKSCNFKVDKYMEPRIGWLRWIKTYETRRDEILDFKKRIEKKEVKTEFDIKYINIMEEEINRAEVSINNLKNTNYVEKMKKDILKREFCHHDYAYHNLLITEEGKLYIIDFDYCMLDTHLHDLCSILIRAMKNGKWSMEKAELILNCYNSLNPVYEDDIPIMAAFIEFPQAYWQLGIQYYWEEQPWEQQVFLDKLNKIYVDRGERQSFVDSFRRLKYRG